MDDEITNKLPEWVRLLRQAVLEAEQKEADNTLLSKEVSHNGMDQLE
jgi:hypothetical protein